MSKTSVDWQNIWLRYINRSMLALSLFGVLDTIHLYVQNQYGFNKGCLGFIDTAIENSFNCQQVVSSEAGKLLGISNTFIGLTFFSLFSIFVLFRIYNVSEIHEKLNQYGGYLLGPAFLYVCYLVYYQYAILEEYCLLCLISAGIVTLLFLLEGSRLMLNRRKFSFFLASTPPTITTELGYRSAIVVIIVLVSAADIMLADYQDGPPTATASEESVYTADSLLLADVKQMTMPINESVECRFRQNEKGSAYNLVSFYDPVIGSDTPDHSIVMYFNPVSSTSLAAFELAQQVLDQSAQQIEVVLKPVAPTIQALEGVRLLYLASEQQATPSLLKALDSLSNENRGADLHLQQLQEAAQRAGLDYDALRNEMDAPQLNGQIYMEKEKALTAEVDTLPAFFIDGRRVAAESVSVACLNKLIKEATNS